VTHTLLGDGRAQGALGRVTIYAVFVGFVTTTLLELPARGPLGSMGGLGPIPGPLLPIAGAGSLLAVVLLLQTVYSTVVV